MVDRSASSVATDRHILHQHPYIECVGVEANDRLAQTTGIAVVVLTDLNNSFLVIAVKNERRCIDHVFFDEMMKNFILLVAERKVRLLRKIVEQVE